MTTATNPTARTLSHRAYQQIRRDIVHGNLQAGSKLKLEALVQHYEIGMSPLREALARLVGDQLVKTEDQRGFWVAPLSLEELDDISRVRELIETEALRLSIALGDSNWEQSLSSAFNVLTDTELALTSQQDSPPQAVIDRWEEANQQFHFSLISACNSPWLIKLQDQLYHQAERYRRVSLSRPRGKRFIHDEHQAIFDAAIQRNALKACRLTQDHLQRTYDAVRKALESIQSE